MLHWFVSFKLPWLTLALTLLLLISRSVCPVTLAPLACDCAMFSRTSPVTVPCVVGAPCLNSRTLKNMWDYRRTIRGTHFPTVVAAAVAGGRGTFAVGSRLLICVVTTGFRHNYARSCCPQPVVANQQLLEAELAAAVACEMGQHTGELAAVLPVTLRVSSSLSPELRPADLVAARNIDLSELASLGESLANREAAVAISGCGGGGDIMLAEALRSFTTFTRAFDESGSSDSDSDVEVHTVGRECVHQVWRAGECGRG